MNMDQDLKQFVDTPQAPAVYTIFRNCLNELIESDIIQNDVRKFWLNRKKATLTIVKELIPCSAEAMLSVFSSPKAHSTRLLNCAKRCVGFSGRTLGKLPVMMHAGYIQRNECTLDEALDALEKAVDDELESRSRMDSESAHEKPSRLIGTTMAVVEDMVVA